MFDFELTELIKTVGLLGVFGIVFAESGLLIGFFLPGDSLLFTAGFLASQGYLNLSLLIVGSFVAAVIGDSVGYAFGKNIGPALFKRANSRWFKQEHLIRAREFYAKYGGRTIVLARFIPFIRTFAPIVAGISEMGYQTFILYNLIGGALWAVGVPFLGYFLGSIIPNVDQLLLPIIATIILVSILPPIVEYMRRRKKG
ncbi:VTT domain-containing protein [Candidatus Berkelbacteria bacterium]|nr:VTT domain-containing protein [Candidatus Berkelbacteria bacterium]